MKTSRLMVMAGGTGGHVFPALAVAKELRDAGTEITWLGTKRGLESKVIPANDIDIEIFAELYVLSLVESVQIKVLEGVTTDGIGRCRLAEGDREFNEYTAIFPGRATRYFAPGDGCPRRVDHATGKKT